MRKWISCLAVLLVFVSLTAGATAAGVTLHVFTPFADMDFAAQAYMDLVTAWEKESGNIVEDYSGLQDEAYLKLLNEQMGAGDADLVVVPMGLGFTDKQLVPLEELLKAAPDRGAKVFPSMAEADGSILLAPIRLNWEALYVNTDVLEQNGLAVPQSFDELLAVCAALSEKGVTPMANALCEWAEIAMDCAALLGAPQEQYGQPASRDGAKAVLVALTEAGAFGADPWNMTDMDAEAAFLNGQAAMRFDADGLALRVDPARQGSVVVVNPAGTDGQPRTAVVGNPGYGLALTRACWEDAARREAALSLAQTLFSPEAARKLAAGADSTLGASIAGLTVSAEDAAGLLYDMNVEGFDQWAEEVVSALMAL